MRKNILHTKAEVSRENITEDGVIDGVIGSTAVVDRYGDVIVQDGWDLKNYKNNKVILWGHNVKEDRPPIGKALKVWVQDKGTKAAKLMFKIQFDMADAFAVEIFRKIKDGFINTVSVGFLPTEWEDINPDDWFSPRRYTKQELLELSVVAVPANPEALMPLKSMAATDKRFEPIESLEKALPQVKDDRDEKKEEIEAAKKKEEEEKNGEEEEVKDVDDPKDNPPTEDEEKEEEEEKTEEEKTEEVKEEVKSAREVIEKAGRVLSSKNEKKVRQAADLLSEVLEGLAKEEPVEEDPEKTISETSKKVIPYKDLGTLPESESWDGPGEVAKAEVEDLKIMCAWYDTEKSDTKSSYKLPHHKAEGHKAVWRGVTAAMAALLGARGGTDIPEEERKGVYNHLVKHYKEFDKEVPEFKMVEDQVLRGLEEELHALVLEREDKHIVRLINKVLDNQKEIKQIKNVEVKQEVTVAKDTLKDASEEQVIKALEVINIALSSISSSEKGGAK